VFGFILPLLAGFEKVYEEVAFSGINKLLFYVG